MRRTFAGALVVGMVAGMLPGCGVAPDRPASWHVQALGAQQQLALDAINRAFASLQTAQAAAQTRQLAQVVQYLQDAQRHLESGNIAQAFPQRREAIQQVHAQLLQAIEQVQKLPAMGATIAGDRNVLMTDIIMPLQHSLNRAEAVLVGV